MLTRKSSKVSNRKFKCLRNRVCAIYSTLFGCYGKLVANGVGSVFNVSYKLLHVLYSMIIYVISFWFWYAFVRIWLLMYCGHLL